MTVKAPVKIDVFGAVVSLCVLLIAFVESSGASAQEPSTEQVGSQAVPESLTPEDVEAIRAVFDGYREALLMEDGERAAAQVDRAAIDHFARIVQKAITAEKEEVLALSLMDRLILFSVRHRSDPFEMAELAPRPLFGRMLDLGWFGDSSALLLARLGDPLLEDGVAKLSLIAPNGVDTGFKFEFVKEEDGWKFRLLPLIDVSAAALTQLMEVAGLSEEELVRMTLEARTGRALSPDIWAPPTPNAKGALPITEAEARELFRRYSIAALGNDGIAAMRTLGGSWLNTLARLHELTLRGGPEEIGPLDFADKHLIAEVRAKMTLSELVDLDAAQFGERLFDEGLVSIRMGVNLTARDVRLVDGKPTLVLTSDFRVSGAEVALVRDDAGDWRLDPAALREFQDRTFRQLAVRVKNEESEDALLAAMSMLMGLDVDASIWNVPQAPRP